MRFSWRGQCTQEELKRKERMFQGGRFRLVMIKPHKAPAGQWLRSLIVPAIMTRSSHGLCEVILFILKAFLEKAAPPESFLIHELPVLK